MSGRKKVKLNIPRLILFVVILFGIIGIGAGTGFVLGIVKNMPDLESITSETAFTSIVYDREGNEIARLHGSENREDESIENIPKMVQDCFIAAEDHRFRSHHGVDIRAYGRVILANIKHGWGSEGGSTITMQLARNAIIKNNEKVLKRKIQEVFIAIQLERIFTKDEILELYMNQVYFGHGAFGIKTAAKTYFDKDVKDLTLSESALLAGLVQRPSAYDPFVNPDLAIKRRNIILDKMERFGFITDSNLIEEAKKEPLKLTEKENKTDNKNKKYGYYIDHVVDEASELLSEIGINPIQVFNGGFKIYTNMDTVLQDKLEDVYKDKNFFPRSRTETPVQSAAIFIEPDSGAILGMMGGREYTVKRGLNRATGMKRQPGSVIKPLVSFGPAVEKGYMPSTVIDDVPTVFPGGYTPRNYDGRYRGLITMRTAIQYSINVPAVKMLNTIGVDTGFEFGKKLGLSLLESDKNLSLALGGLTKGVSPLELASAYGAFANEGVRIEPHAITKIEDGEGNVIIDNKPRETRVMKEQTAYIVTDMLKTVVDSGTGTRARIPGRPVAGKTGTTQLPDAPEFRGKRGNKDAWFAAYTPEIVGVVWMGYDKTTSKNYLVQEYGGNLPARIWKEVVTETLKGKPVKKFKRPAGITYTQVDTKSGMLPSSLTPSQFIVTEIFTNEALPKKISDVWINGEICAASKKIPTESCPFVTSGVFLQRPTPYTPPSGFAGIYPEDWNLTYPRLRCDIHGSGASNTFLICTDPRHDGRLVLALVPKNGETGGCPQEFLREQYFEDVSEVPREYCNLPEHQITKSASGNNGNNAHGENISPSIVVTGSNQNYAVRLSWNNVGNYTYHIIRRSSSDSSYRKIGSTSSNSFTDTGVKAGETYYYQIIWGDTQSSAELKAQIPKGNRYEIDDDDDDDDDDD